MTACNRCSSAVCDGRTVSCLGCGTEQCHMNGLGRGSLKTVCHGCAATRAKIGTRDRVQTQPKVTLAEYVRIAKLPNGYERGVVRAGEVTVPRCLFLLEDDERMVDAQIARARAIGAES